MMRRTVTSFALAVVVSVLCLGARPAGTQGPAGVERAVDKVFGAWGANTPGCAVGVSSNGSVVLEKAYGTADLEHDVANTPDTIFEAGSVSKQFTAAAVLLLARDGKLSLDDPVRKYVPELPDYGQPLLIRHILTHTGGLRDWGEVEAIAGWPRTTRVYTHAHVLDIVSRQKALNFEPGAHWSYSNTGYNLAAIIVSRVSGQPFAEFCQARIFRPLGMTHTSWRDDFTRIVKGRAIAYTVAGKDSYRQNMPFENVHGNGGLLTTVGDLLRWNENFTAPKVGDAGFLRVEQEEGRLNDGTPHGYALGLFVQKYKGVREVGHSGSTAGYRAYLTRFPDQRLSVAVLCNAANGQAERYAHAVADLYLGDAIKPKTPVNAIENDDIVITGRMTARAGMYRNVLTGAPLTILYESPIFKLDAPGDLALNQLYPETDSRFTSLNRERVYLFDAKGRLSVPASNGIPEVYERVQPAHPSAIELKSLAGTYVSDEAEVRMEVSAEGNDLKLTMRPDTKLTLRPLYTDAFAAPRLRLIRFNRDAGARVVGFSISTDRVWDLRFERRVAQTGS